MNKKQLAFITIIVLSLGACTRLGVDNSGTNQNPSLFGNNLGQASSPPVSVAIAASDIGDLLDEEAAIKLTNKERSEAASAQFYALQFGRVGAPRVWQGDSGASGRVSVGPYVRVNSLDCRQFTHVVTIKETSYEREGTACREADGSWDIVDS